MGCCLSTPASPANKQVDRELNSDKKLDDKIKKLLFLGSGGSGKSTLFKQLRSIHGSGYEGKDRVQFKDHINAQIIEQMRLSVDCIEILREEYSEQYGDLQLSEEAEEVAAMLEGVKHMKLTDEVTNAIKLLWKEDAIKVVYENRALMKIDDSSKYFWDNIDRISDEEFVPTDEDILLVRYRTTGVIEQKFEIKSNIFHIFDVGGQKSERRKWIHCFEHVTAVIFVAALSCYDEVMFEDENQNSMMDSLELFDEVCNNEYFSETAMILFLNKKDLFAEKIKRVPLTYCQELTQNFDADPNSYDDCSQYIREQFEEKNKNAQKTIFSHITNATDRDNVNKVFGDVQHVIINMSLQQGGLIGMN